MSASSRGASTSWWTSGLLELGRSGAKASCLLGPGEQALSHRSLRPVHLSMFWAARRPARRSTFPAVAFTRRHRRIRRRDRCSTGAWSALQARRFTRHRLFLPTAVSRAFLQATLRPYNKSTIFRRLRQPVLSNRHFHLSRLIIRRNVRHRRPSSRRHRRRQITGLDRRHRYRLTCRRRHSRLSLVSRPRRRCRPPPAALVAPPPRPLPAAPPPLCLATTRKTKLRPRRRLCPKQDSRSKAGCPTSLRRCRAKSANRMSPAAFRKQAPKRKMTRMMMMMMKMSRRNPGWDKVAKISRKSLLIVIKTRLVLVRLRSTARAAAPSLKSGIPPSIICEKSVRPISRQGPERFRLSFLLSSMDSRRDLSRQTGMEIYLYFVNQSTNRIFLNHGK